MSQFRVCFDRHLNDLALNASPRDAHALQSPPAIAWSFPIGRRGALDLWWTIIPVDRFHRWFLLLFFIFSFPLYIYPCTNNNIRDEDKREFEFRIDLFYFPFWNSLNEMKLSLLNNYDQENNNFSRWYISIFFSFSVGNLVFVFSLPFLFFFQNIFRETKLLEIVWNCAWREFVTQFVNVNQYIWWKYRYYGSCSLFEIVNPPVENDRTCTGNARRSA